MRKLPKIDFSIKSVFLGTNHYPDRQIFGRYIEALSTLFKVIILNGAKFTVNEQSKLTLIAFYGLLLFCIIWKS